MSLFKKIIASREVERAYNQFMLNFELQALRIACIFLIISGVLFLMLDYVRLTEFRYVLVYRARSMLVILVVILLTYRKKTTTAYLDLLCLGLSVVVPAQIFFLDATGSMPDFFLANALTFGFYVINACLGHSMRIKVVHTGAFVVFFILYSRFISPHSGFHASQVWNVLINASMSLLIGALVSWFKRLSFVNQQQLIESESKFRQISETINDVFYLYNFTDKRYEFISKNCQEVLGAPQDFFYSGGKYTQTFVISEDHRKLLEAYQRAESGTPYEEEFRTVIDGDIKWIREKAFPIKDSAGQVVKKSGTCTDITHLKFQELQLMSQKRNLENLNSTKDKFFSIVAHDLKSPLISLKSFIDLLIHRADRFEKEEIIETGKQVLSSVDNTIKMTDNLITWARLQMNDFKSHFEKIYFREVVATILPVYKNVAEKKGITLSWSFEDNLTIYADKNQLEFIIRNLLNNAVKFTRRGGQVTLTARSLHHAVVQISVADNGIGISEEGKRKIFSVGTTQPIKGTAGELGTGLGLMLCYEFAKLNHGTIEVESEEGKGSTFHVRLNETELADT